jgi:hypothetical protein
MHPPKSGPNPTSGSSADEGRRRLLSDATAESGEFHHSADGVRARGEGTREQDRHVAVECPQISGEPALAAVKKPTPDQGMTLATKPEHWLLPEGGDCLRRASCTVHDTLGPAVGGKLDQPLPLPGGPCDDCRQLIHRSPHVVNVTWQVPHAPCLRSAARPASWETLGR